jgi:hypothetical protein
MYHVHGKDENSYNTFVVKPERKCHLGDQGADWILRLKLPLKEQDFRSGLDSSGSG